MSVRETFDEIIQQEMKGPGDLASCTRCGHLYFVRSPFPNVMVMSLDGTGEVSDAALLEPEDVVRDDVDGTIGSRCPHCNTQNETPHKMPAFRVVGSIRKVLREATTADLETALTVLSAAREADASPTDVRTALEATANPRLNVLAQMFKPEDGPGLNALLTLIVTVIMLFLALKDGGDVNVVVNVPAVEVPGAPQPDIEDQIDTAIREALESMPAATSTTVAGVVAEPTAGGKQKRNADCACGSGAKFKWCCGR